MKTTRIAGDSRLRYFSTGDVKLEADNTAMNLTTVSVVLGDEECSVSFSSQKDTTFISDVFPKSSALDSPARSPGSRDNLVKLLIRKEETPEILFLNAIVYNILDTRCCRFLYPCYRSRDHKGSRNRSLLRLLGASRASSR